RSSSAARPSAASSARRTPCARYGMVSALEAQIGTGDPDPPYWPPSRPVWLFYGSCPPRPLLVSGRQGQRHRGAAKELTQVMRDLARASEVERDVPTDPEGGTARPRALRRGLASDDPALLQGMMTLPPLECVNDWAVEGADLTAY